MKTPAPEPPALAMIDTPGGERFYFIPPVPPGVYSPAIRIVRGVIRPCYVIPNRLGIGSTYSEGSAKVCKRHRELMGILAALAIMGKVWQGLLDKYDGACNDIGQQSEIANALTGPPLAAFAMIEKSGKLGSLGMPQKAADLIRNVMALAHWKAIWQLRIPGKSLMPDGKPKPGAIHWNDAAVLMNEICRDAFPDLDKRQWTAFTGTTLCKLAERAAVILDPKSGV